MFLRVNRYVDEDIALVNGYYFFKSFFIRENEFLVKAGVLDGANSIGLLVTLPATIGHYLSNNIVGPRVTMGLWSFVFSLVAALTFFEVLKKVSQDPISSWEKYLFSWILMAWLYVVPIGVQIQTMVLSEYPGLTLVFLSFFLVLKKRPVLAMFFCSLATLTKLNFLLYSPLVLLLCVVCFDKVGKWSFNLRMLVQLSIVFALPIVFLQLVKFLLYGTQGFLFGWKWYLNWILNNSGAGLNQAAVKVNEFPDYAFSIKVFLISSSIAPILFSFFFWRARKTNLWMYLALVVLACTICFASYQWFFMANLKWLRRTLYFMVPGVWVTIACCLIFLRHQRLRRIFIYRAGIFFLAILALHLVWKRTLGPIVRGETPLLTQVERVRFDPNYTVLFDLKENLSDPKVFERVLQNSK